MATSQDVTRLLVAWSNGDREALNKLMPLVYDELHRMAGRYLQLERPNHTLQATALVNEAFLRMVDQSVEWQSRAHFFAIAARMMRRILVDYAHARKASKRGGADFKLSLDEMTDLPEGKNLDIV